MFWYRCPACGETLSTWVDDGPTRRGRCWNVSPQVDVELVRFEPEVLVWEGDNA